MNDLHHPCEPWTELISLAAAGCLSPDEERDVRQHVDTCSDCRARFDQLTELCGTLAATPLPVDIAEAAIVQRVMSTVASESDAPWRPTVRTQGEMIPFRSLNQWRWIMRSPIPRVSAAAVVLLAVAGVAMWFLGGGATFAFADFIAPILEAKSAKFKTKTEIEGPPAMTTTGEVMVFNATRSRHEMVMQPMNSKLVMIVDWGQGKSISLDPANQKAVVVSLDNLTEEQIAQQDMFASFRSILLDARDKPDVKREPLGEQDIDGRRVIGFRVTSRGMVVSLWGDPETGLPVRAEVTMAMFANTKTTFSDFVFDVDLDESLFSVEPPVDYAVQNMNVDVSPPQEADLITTFREYQQLSGGDFPDELELRKIAEMVGAKLAFEMAAENAAAGQEPPSAEQAQENRDVHAQRFTEIQMRMQRGLLFALTTTPRDADAHYVGKGVEFGAAETPIFWYSPQDSKKYRIIYADLSVRDSDTPPNIPTAQPLPAPSSARE